MFIVTYFTICIKTKKAPVFGGSFLMYVISFITYQFPPLSHKEINVKPEICNSNILHLVIFQIANIAFF